MTVDIQCPKCDGKIDHLIVSHWGDPSERNPLAPYVCGMCASVLLLDVEKGYLYTPEVIRKALDLDVLAIMQSNAALWAEITENVAMVRKMPNLRRVLR
jgi:hypothetical protein